MAKIPLHLLDYIYENNYYELNIEMLQLMLKTKGNFNQVDFDTRNFYSIKSSNCETLTNYVKSNLEDYIKNVYLNLPSNNDEDESCLIELLNEKELSQELKTKIIQKVNTKINDLTSIDKLEVDELLFTESKVEATWNNVFNNYENREGVITQPVISFINDEANAKELSNTKILAEEEIQKNFIVDILKTEEFTNQAYELILKSISYSYDALSFEGLSEAKVRALIHDFILVFNETNFNLIKSNFEDLLIIFIEFNKSLFLSKISSFDLDMNDIFKLLTSVKLSDNEKNLIVQKVDQALIISNKKSLTQIGEIILENISFRIDDLLLERILLTDGLPIEKRIKIFNINHHSISVAFIPQFLTSLQEPYSEITIHGKRPLLTYSENNEKMVQILDSKKYISSFDKEPKGIRVNTFFKTHDN